MAYVREKGEETTGHGEEGEKRKGESDKRRGDGEGVGQEEKSRKDGEKRGGNGMRWHFLSFERGGAHRLATTSHTIK